MRGLRRLIARTRPAVPPQRETLVLTLAQGRNIQVLRVRDPRARRLKLTVNEQGGRLTVPPHASVRDAEHFLHAHLPWLVEQLDRQATLGDIALVPGQTAWLPLRGREVPLRWQHARALGISPDADDGVCIHWPPRAAPAAVRRVLRDFYEAQGRADVGRWLPTYLPGLPRAPRRILFKRTRSLWGSLTVDGSLMLDLALLLAPPAVFEYVLVHELCHLLHRDHSPRFWREVESRCPDWRRHRDLLKQDGMRLKARLRALLTG